MITRKKADPLTANPLDPVAALALIRAELQREAETPEPGYLTAEQWAEAWGMSRERTAKLLKKSKYSEERTYRINVGSFVRKVRHFRVVGKPA